MFTICQTLSQRGRRLTCLPCGAYIIGDSTIMLQSLVSALGGASLPAWVGPGVWGAEGWLLPRGLSVQPVTLSHQLLSRESTTEKALSPQTQLLGCNPTHCVTLSKLPNRSGATSLIFDVVLIMLT